MGILRVFGKMLEAGFDEATKPESFRKGEKFEQYVRDVVFPKSTFTLVHKTHDYKGNRGDYVESSLKPDYLFRKKKSRKEFYVEVKWRSGYYNKEIKIEWCNQKQLKRYKAINKNEAKVFVIIGFGDYPDDPDGIVLFPLDACNYTGLYDSFLDKYNFYAGKPVFPGYLWKLK